MILLDTHTLVWWRDSTAKLSNNAHAAIAKEAKTGTPLLPPTRKCTRIRMCAQYGDLYFNSSYGPPRSIARWNAGRAWMRLRKSVSFGRVASSPPRAAAASSGKLIWMSA